MLLPGVPDVMARYVDVGAKRGQPGHAWGVPDPPSMRPAVKPGRTASWADNPRRAIPTGKPTGCDNGGYRNRRLFQEEPGETGTEPGGSAPGSFAEARLEAIRFR